MYLLKSLIIIVSLQLKQLIQTNLQLYVKNI